MASTSRANLDGRQASSASSSSSGDNNNSNAQDVSTASASNTPNYGSTPNLTTTANGNGNANKQTQQPKPSLVMRIRRRLPIPSHIPLHTSMTYLCAICLFSISFLVFLNSSLSFVVMEVLHVKENVGDIVGTLGFVDELVAVVCVVGWGSLSDKIGTRMVACIGYAIVGLSLFVIVQSKNVYPDLLLARMLFSLGASATATMVSAVLPELSTLPPADKTQQTDGDLTIDPNLFSPPNGTNARTPLASSASSTVTATSNFSIQSARRRLLRQQRRRMPKNISGKLSGLVGFTAGIGALFALVVLLPLPNRFSRNPDISQAEAVKRSFYTVAGLSWAVGLVCFVGLRGGGVGGEPWRFWKICSSAVTNNKGKNRCNGDSNGATTTTNNDEENNGDASSSNRASDESERRPLLADTPANISEDYTRTFSSRDSTYAYSTRTQKLKMLAEDYFTNLSLAVRAAGEDHRLGLAYLGGFVARASSVGISLFIPLFVNQYMLSQGICDPEKAPKNPHDPAFKEQCRAAYILAAELTGTSQLMALLFAPLFGYFADRHAAHVPLLTAGVVGFFSFIGFTMLPSLNPGADRSWGFLLVAGMGISQIGAIVCSLALIGKSVTDDGGVLNNNRYGNALNNNGTYPYAENPRVRDLIIDELTATSAAPTGTPVTSTGRMKLKGAIAGVYSLSGAVGILILTKVGGWGADKLGRGVPFHVLALFCVIEVAAGSWLVVRSTRYL